MRNSNGIWRAPTDRAFGVGMAYITFVGSNEDGSMFHYAFFQPTEDDVRKAAEDYDIPFGSLMIEIHEAKMRGDYGLVFDVNRYRDHLKETGWL